MGGERRGLPQGGRGKLTETPGIPHDHVGAGSAGRMQPEVVGPGHAEGEMIVVPAAPADQDLQPVAADEDARHGAPGRLPALRS